MWPPGAVTSAISTYELDQLKDVKSIQSHDGGSFPGFLSHHMVPKPVIWAGVTPLLLTISQSQAVCLRGDHWPHVVHEY